MHQRKRAVYRFADSTVKSLLPRIVCWTRSGSRNWRDRWLQTVRHLGLQYAEICREGERTDSHGHVVAWTTVYDVWGTPLALEELLQPDKYPVVDKWEYFVRYQGPRPSDTGGIPVGQGTGMGTPKRRSSVPDGTTSRELEIARNRPLSD